MPASPLPAGRISGAGNIAYNLAGISVTVLMMAVGFAYLIDLSGRQGAESKTGSESAITQTIGGRDLSIPENLFRYGEQMRPGFVNQIDLALELALPGLDKPVPVNVTLVPRSRARASSVLLDAVYLHQFAEGMVGGVPGL